MGKLYVVGFGPGGYEHMTAKCIDVIKNADYIIDMGPGGGQDGGQIVAKGSVEQIKKNARSITGRYL